MSPRHTVDVTHEGCLATREVLNRVGDKWSVLIVGLLGEGRLRFGELRWSIEGISQRMLTLTLRGLERDGCPEIEQLPFGAFGTLDAFQAKFGLSDPFPT